MDDDRKPRDLDQDQDLLQEIRDTYADFAQQWREIQEHSQKCRKYLDGDPWDEEDRLKRKNNGRPCINHDELNQYINQWVGNIRQNKRGIKVQPGGAGANAKSAEFRQNLIRGIEYRSKAPQAYIAAGEQMIEGGYGFVRVGRKYVDRRRNRHQELTISVIPNQDSVLYDPYCKQPDGSDARRVFVLDPIPRSKFVRDYPDAQIRDFTPEHMALAKDWLQDKQVLVAEYWRLEGDDDDGYELVQYITNGIEILEDNPQEGLEHIPIIPFCGKQRYVNEGGVAKRKIYALVSHALEPQLSLAFLVSQELEEAGKSPKTPLRGWKGQFETDRKALEDLNHTPVSFVQFDMPEWALERGITLPLPEPVTFTPNFQEYEVAKDGARRAIQAGVGSSPLPTAAQRDNEKSGVALERISAQQDLGSYHFTDNYDNALEYCGRVVEENIAVTYIEEGREVALRMPDDKQKVVTLNTKEPYYDEEAKEHVHYRIDGDGEHDLEVSTGPSYKSQWEEAAKFVDTLIAALPTLPIPPAGQAKLLALAIQMRNLGPKGDEMAEIISPSTDQPVSPQAMAQIQAAQVQVQQQGALIQQLQGELLKLQNEKQAKIVDNEYRMALERLKIESQLAMAEVTTKAQQLNERLQFIEDVWRKLNVEQPHEAALDAMNNAHERQLTDQQHQNALDQAAAQPAPAESAPVQQ